MKYQFYLVENPKGDHEDEYIFHAKNPRFIAKIIPLQEDIQIAHMQYEGANTTFFYINPESIREIYTLVVVQQFDEATEEQIDGKLKRMADWWTDYLMWQDRQQFGNGGQKSLLRDYNETTPLLKIIYSKFSKRWIIIYKGIVKTFPNEIEMDQYLIQKLNFTEEQLEEGYLNEL